MRPTGDARLPTDANNPATQAAGGYRARLAWALGVLCVAMFIAAVVLTFLTLLAEDAPPSVMASELALLVPFLPFLAFPVVGALIGSRRPRNPIGWICLSAGLFFMLIGVGEEYAAYELARSGPVRISVALSALIQGLWALPVGLLGIYMILLFPDGRLLSRRWRPLAWFAGAVMAVICVSFVLVPGPLGEQPGVRNPFGVEWLAWMADVTTFVVLLVPLCILASVSSLVLRYRRSGTEVRQQIKWLAFAAAIVGLAFLGSLLGQLLFAPDTLKADGAPQSSWGTLDNLVVLSYAGIPIAVGIAVLKYRLYDIEIIVNRTLVYVSLTATLAVIYAGSVISLQYAFRALTGQTSQLVIVASTLAIAALFNPLRRRIQALVDRRFYRAKYEARKTLESFSARLRDVTDLETLNDDLVEVVGEAIQPEHVRLWLSPGAESTPKVRAEEVAR